MSTLKYLLSIFLLLVTVLVYWQTTHHGFFLYDDWDYVVNNENIQGGLTFQGVAWAFSSFECANWHPVTWLSHMLDVQLLGRTPSGHHLVNVGLHAMNAVLVFFLLMKLTAAVWRSFAVALLFAIHPLHAESVAWIAERKDLLSGLFFMLTLMAWQWYVTKNTVPRYLCALALFGIGLMSKPMLVTLPFILLLLDWWPLDRYGRHRSPSHLFVEKIPFFLLAAGSSLITFLAQHQGGAVVAFDKSPLLLRLSNAMVSYGLYLRKMFLPYDLVVYYPYLHSISWWSLATYGTLFVAASLVFLRLRYRYPYLIVGWLWYLGMLVPVIGVIRVGAQAMADRYTYLPLLGPFIMIAWGSAEAATLKARKIVILAFTLATGLLVFVTWQQVGYWKSDIILFSRVLEYVPVTPITLADLAKAYSKRGEELKKQWKLEEALENFKEAAARSTGTIAANAHNDMGLILAMQGREAEAVREYQAAIRLDPRLTDSFFNIGLIHFDNGRRKEAAACFGEVVRLDPKHENARRYLQESRN